MTLFSGFSAKINNFFPLLRWVRIKIHLPLKLPTRRACVIDNRKREASLANNFGFDARLSDKSLMYMKKSNGQRIDS